MRRFPDITQYNPNRRKFSISNALLSLIHGRYLPEASIPGTLTFLSENPNELYHELRIKIHDKKGGIV